MIDNKRTVFVLGAGASCPYGYPSGAQLRTQICLDLKRAYLEHLKKSQPDQTIRQKNYKEICDFIDTFSNSSTQSIDLFIARNPRFAAVGKYIIAFEILGAEHRSHFREQAKVAKERHSEPCSNPAIVDFVERGYFQGEDWYSYLFSRLNSGLTKPDVLPDFSDDKISFITFNYDRSLEQFLYESLTDSFAEVPETEVVKCLKQLKILHIYGQVAPLKWQDSDKGIDYRPVINESLLQKAASNIKTIYEQKKSSELNDAQELLAGAQRIFFLGFAYAPENMEVLTLPEIVSPHCLVYGTAFNLIREEAERIESAINHDRIKAQDYFNARPTKIEPCLDCLMLLRKYLTLS